MNLADVQEVQQLPLKAADAMLNQRTACGFNLFSLPLKPHHFLATLSASKVKGVVAFKFQEKNWKVLNQPLGKKKSTSEQTYLNCPQKGVSLNCVLCDQITRGEILQPLLGAEQELTPNNGPAWIQTLPKGPKQAITATTKTCTTETLQRQREDVVLDILRRLRILPAPNFKNRNPRRKNRTTTVISGNRQKRF